MVDLKTPSSLPRLSDVMDSNGDRRWFVLRGEPLPNNYDGAANANELVDLKNISQRTHLRKPSSAFHSSSVSASHHPLCA
jgi:hypothetical protein